MNRRPRTLEWQAQGTGFVANSALGLYTIHPRSVHTFSAWICALNGESFPVVFPDVASLKHAVAQAQSLHGEPSLALAWSESPPFQAQGLETTWALVQSHGTGGWFATANGTPAWLPFSEQQAKNACQVHVSLVWYAMSEPVS